MTARSVFTFPERGRNFELDGPAWLEPPSPGRHFEKESIDMNTTSTITLLAALILNACGGGDTVTNYVPEEGTGGSATSSAGSSSVESSIAAAATGGSAATGGHGATGGQAMSSCVTGSFGCSCLDPVLSNGNLCAGTMHCCGGTICLPQATNCT